MVNFLGAGHILKYIRINIYNFGSYIYLLTLAKLEQYFDLYGKGHQTITFQVCNWIFAMYS